MRALAIFVVLLVAVWLLVRSATHMPGQSHSGPLAPLTEHEQALRDELRRHLTELAGRIGERNLDHPAALDEAAAFVTLEFREMDYEVRRQSFQVRGRAVQNLEVELRGRSKPEEIVVIGAHYDSVIGTPGANDNASGVAALLALARWARGKQFARTLRFVAFVNEEPPYFQTSSMGSLVYARAAKQRGDRIVAMLSLETIGYYSDEPGSQHYPAPFGLMYPDTGNFITFVGNYGSRELVRRSIGAFRRSARFPSEGAAPPGAITGVGWSDHWAFWQQGYPGLMVTDTALFRYPWYHTAKDTPDQLDYDHMARIVASMETVVSNLAQE